MSGDSDSIHLGGLHGEADDDEDDASDVATGSAFPARGNGDWPDDPTVWCCLVGNPQLEEPVCVNAEDYDARCIQGDDSADSATLFGFCQLKYMPIPSCDVSFARHLELQPTLDVRVLDHGWPSSTFEHASACE